MNMKSQTFVFYDQYFFHLNFIAQLHKNCLIILISITVTFFLTRVYQYTLSVLVANQRLVLGNRPRSSEDNELRTCYQLQLLHSFTLYRSDTGNFDSTVTTRSYCSSEGRSDNNTWSLGHSLIQGSPRILVKFFRVKCSF